MLKYTKSVTAMALTAVAGAAQAEYPEKPVEFVVPWPPGDLEDVLTRMIAEDFSEAVWRANGCREQARRGRWPIPRRDRSRKRAC